MGPTKQAIEQGRLGKIFAGFFRVNWHRSDEYFLANGGWRGSWDMDGGGSLMNQGVHTVDLMQWLLGEVESIRSHMAILDHNIETEDFTSSVIKFKSGAIVNLVSTTCAYPGLGTDIQITGTNGSIHIDGSKLLVWKIKGERMQEEEAEMLEKYGSGGTIAAADHTIVRGHDYVIQDMIDAVRFDRDPMIMPLEATKAVRIINAVYESARTGKEIFF
jgi:UDP-N-acetyl-2-amino-2-deoxyglucuronate dehydrogenase